MMDKAKQSGIEFSPLRSLDDFLLESARFQIPNLNDFEKWGKRVVNNLLYYQTNYFVLSAIIFLIIGVIHPTKMLSGIFISGLAVGIFMYISKEYRAINHEKQQYRWLVATLLFIAAYIILHMLGSILIFLFGILLPFGVTFVHASMRLRNIRNKLVNKMEIIGIKRTPMGLFLDAMGLEQEIFS